MSRYERRSLAVNVVGFLIVILTLAATWFQLRQVTKQNRMIVHGQREASTIGLDRLFVEYPEVREYFYGGVDIDEKNSLYRRTEAIAEMHLDVFDYRLQHVEIFPEFQPFRPTERIFIVDMFRSSPVLRKYCEKRKTWYSPELLELLAQSQK